jgi:hypothetical protein
MEEPRRAVSSTPPGRHGGHGAYGGPTPRVDRGHPRGTIRGARAPSLALWLPAADIHPCSVYKDHGPACALFNVGQLDAVHPALRHIVFFCW